MPNLTQQQNHPSMNPDTLKALIGGIVAIATTIFAINKKKTKTTKHKVKTKGYQNKTPLPYNKGDN